MFLGSPAILNCKPRAAMQTAKAHHALFLDPYRPFSPYFDSLHRTFPCAQPAADAALLHMKMRCKTHPAIIKRLSDPLGKDRRRMRGHVPIPAALSDAANDPIDVLFGGSGVLPHLFRCGKIKDRRPCIDHPDGVVSVDVPALFAIEPEAPGVVP